MNRITFILICLMCIPGFCRGMQGGSDSELFSTSTAEFFLTVGNEVYSQNPEDPDTVEEAMLFVQGALSLDSQFEKGWYDLLRIGSSSTDWSRDYSEIIRTGLSRNVSSQSNLAVIEAASAYLLDRLNSRPEREALLGKLLTSYGSRNEVFGSDLATHLALLEAERADGVSAVTHLRQALKLDPYNGLAYEVYRQLTAGTPAEPSEVEHARQLRYAVDRHPLDFATAVLLADFLRAQQAFESAAKVYSYAAELDAYLYRDQPLAREIYLPWARCCLKQKSTLAQCLQIVEQVRDTGRFDLLLEGLGVKARQLLDADQDEWGLLQLVGRKAEQAIDRGNSNLPVTEPQLCWFYCFALPEPEKALAWGHESLSRNKDDPDVRSLFGYALLMNGLVDLAKEYAEPYEDQNAIAKLTLGIIDRLGKKEDAALAKIREVVSTGPETLVGIRAMEILGENDSDYIPDASSLGIEQMLIEAFGEEIVPEFLPAGERIEAALDFRGSQSVFGHDLNATLLVRNTGNTPCIVRDGAFFEGYIRIDAEIRGDVRMQIAGLIDRRFRPSEPIEPGEFAAMDLNLSTGKLRKVLQRHPQANMEIDFHVWLDPVADESGKIQSRYPDLDSFRQTMKRSSLSVSREFLMQRLDVLSSGREGQKEKVAELFSSLLNEQAAARRGKVSYRYIQVEPSLLMDGLRMLAKDENWRIRAHTQAILANSDFRMDYGLISAVSANMNHEQWPVRLGAMYILSKAESTNYGEVLAWKAEHDPFWINRRMAAVLGDGVVIPTGSEAEDL